jgi:hypothetical protein
MVNMVGKRQFSLGYLSLLVVWFSLAAGFTRFFVFFGFDAYRFDDFGAFCFFMALVSWGAFFGGLFGRMFEGGLGTACVLALLFMLYPALRK